MAGEVINYTSLLDDIKGRIRRAQTRAVLSANREMKKKIRVTPQLISLKKGSDLRNCL